MSQLMSAAGSVEIQVRSGMGMSGFGSRLDGAEGVHDPLFARMLLLQAGPNRMLWLSCDLIGFNTPFDQQLRTRLGESAGVPPAHVFIACTHTHGGPSSKRLRGALGGPDPALLGRLSNDLAALARSLPAALVPTAMRYGTTKVTGLGYNRQDASEPIDETLAVCAFEVPGGRRIATLMNYALHPVILGEVNRRFTADFPGYASRALEARAGGVALWLQGTCGDVDPVNYRDLGRNTGTFEQAAAFGARLAAASEAAIANADIVQPASLELRAVEHWIDIPMDPAPSREELAELRAGFARDRGPLEQRPETDAAKWATFQLEWADELARAIDASAVPDTKRVRISGARIGEVYVFAVPFELYSWIGIELRRKLAPRLVMIAGYTGGVLGYLPTRRAKGQGGYGPAQSHRVFTEMLTAVGFGADELIVREGTELVRSLD